MLRSFKVNLIIYIFVNEAPYNFESKAIIIIIIIIIIKGTHHSMKYGLVLLAAEMYAWADQTVSP